MSDLLSGKGVSEAIYSIEFADKNSGYRGPLVIYDHPTSILVPGHDYFYNTKGLIGKFLEWAKERNSLPYNVVWDDNARKTEEISELKVRLAKAERERDDAKAEAKAAKEHTRHLEAKLHEAKSGAMTRKITNLEKRREAAELERDQALAEKTKAEGLVKELKSNAEYFMNAYYEAMSAKHGHCKVRIEALIAERDKAVKNADHLLGQFVRLGIENQSLQEAKQALDRIYEIALGCQDGEENAC